MDAHLPQLSGPLKFRSGSFPSIIIIEELLSAPVVHTAFKIIFDAIELAMIASSIASSTALI